MARAICSWPHPASPVIRMGRVVSAYFRARAEVAAETYGKSRYRRAGPLPGAAGTDGDKVAAETARRRSIFSLNAYGLKGLTRHSILSPNSFQESADAFESTSRRAGQERCA